MNSSRPPWFALLTASVLLSCCVAHASEGAIWGLPAQTAEAKMPPSEGAGFTATFVEFQVPQEEVLSLVGKLRDYEALLVLAKSGKAGINVVALTGTDGQTALVRSGSFIRYPESFGDYQFAQPVTAKAKSGKEKNAEKKTEPTTPAPDKMEPKNPPKTPPPGPLFSTPQDYTVQEIGTTVEMTVMSGEGKSARCKIKYKHIDYDVVAGESLELNGYPNMPEFSVFERNVDIVAERGKQTLVSCLPPAPSSKETRTRILFLLID